LLVWYCLLTALSSSLLVRACDRDDDDGTASLPHQLGVDGSGSMAPTPPCGGGLRKLPIHRTLTKTWFIYPTTQLGVLHAYYAFAAAACCARTCLSRSGYHRSPTSGWLLTRFISVASPRSRKSGQPPHSQGVHVDGYLRPHRPLTNVNSTSSLRAFRASSRNRSTSAGTSMASNCAS
jgi:hypothetical protein